MFEKLMTDGNNSIGNKKKPEFILKKELKGELSESEMREKIMLEKSGFAEGECQDLMRVCSGAFNENFASKRRGYIDGSLPMFDFGEIIKISDKEAKIVGKGRMASGTDLGMWEMRVVKDGDAWRVERAEEV